MQVYRITDKKDKWFNAFREIYEVSFPLFEQRDLSQQEKALSHPDYHLDIYIEENKLCAFIAYWVFDNYLYIEHLAVNPTLRGKNIGTQILHAFNQEKGKLILLEIDPPVDDISRKRWSFYQKLGFCQNKYPHYHPAYKKAYSPHLLVILSLPKPLTEDLYKQFDRDLKEIVMDL